MKIPHTSQTPFLITKHFSILMTAPPGKIYDLNPLILICLMPRPCNDDLWVCVFDCQKRGIFSLKCVLICDIVHHKRCDIKKLCLISDQHRPKHIAYIVIPLRLLILVWSRHAAKSDILVKRPVALLFLIPTFEVFWHPIALSFAFPYFSDTRDLFARFCI